MNQYFITSPMEQFEIRDIWYQWILGFSATLTNFGFYVILAFLIIFSYFYLADNNDRIVPNRWSIGQESLYATIHNMVISQINGKKGQEYFPLIFTLFFVILVCNLMSNIPYSFAVTSHLIFTLGLSITILIGVTIIGFNEHGLKFFALFVPAGTPLGLVPLLVLIEFVSYLARAVSLGLRLGANLISGHLLLVILAGFIYNIMTTSIIFFLLGLIPFALVVGIAGLELAISMIQAYVFVLLTCSYLKDCLDLH